MEAAAQLVENGIRLMGGTLSKIKDLHAVMRCIHQCGGDYPPTFSPNRPGAQKNPARRRGRNRCIHQSRGGRVMPGRPLLPCRCWPAVNTREGCGERPQNASAPRSRPYPGRPLAGEGEDVLGRAARRSSHALSISSAHLLFGVGGSSSMSSSRPGRCARSSR